jgi:hypothetical protein
VGGGASRGREEAVLKQGWVSRAAGQCEVGVEAEAEEVDDLARLPVPTALGL